MVCLYLIVWSLETSYFEHPEFVIKHKLSVYHINLRDSNVDKYF